MKIRKKYVFIILFIIMALSSILLLNEEIWANNDVIIYEISVITSGKSNESLMIMKEGIEQAASEMNVNISFITLSEENNVEEQKKLLDREVKNGADAILIAPAVYEGMSDEIESARKKTAVILIDSNIKTEENIPYIGCNNEELGASLADEVIKMGNTRGKIAIVNGNLGYSTVMERYNGFMSAILKSNNYVEFIDILLDEKDSYDKVLEVLNKKEFDAIVTFDVKTLELLAQCKKDINALNEEQIQTEIYGTGGTSKVTSFLEDDIIKATAIQNEFNIGYLGVKMAVDIINNKYVENTLIYSAVIDKRSMYTEENERLLFPLIK